MDAFVSQYAAGHGKTRVRNFSSFFFFFFPPIQNNALKRFVEKDLIENRAHSPSTLVILNYYTYRLRRGAPQVTLPCPRSGNEVIKRWETFEMDVGDYSVVPASSRIVYRPRRSRFARPYATLRITRPSPIHAGPCS